MRLVIKRSQAEQVGIFGGHKGMKFLLACRVDLTPEESGLVTKYKAEHELLTHIKIGDDVKQSGFLFIKDLVAGKSYECKNVTELLQAEEEIKKGCENFKTLLTVMTSFGGEEVIEFSHPSKA